MFYIIIKKIFTLQNLLHLVTTRHSPAMIRANFPQFRETKIKSLPSIVLPTLQETFEEMY